MKPLIVTLTFLLFTAGAFALEKPFITDLSLAAANGNDTVYTHDTMRVTLPQFFDVKKLNNGDTTYEVKCYDAQDSIMTSWKSFDEVYFVSVFKKYTDYKHTYKDHGRELPLPVSIILYRYDKIAPGKWQNIDYNTKAYSVLKEDPRTVIKKDVTHQRLVIQRYMPDVIEVRDMAIIYQYYKVAP